MRRRDVYGRRCLLAVFAAALIACFGAIPIALAEEAALGINGGEAWIEVVDENQSGVDLETLPLVETESASEDMHGIELGEDIPSGSVENDMPIEVVEDGSGEDLSTQSAGYDDPSTAMAIGVNAEYSASLVKRYDADWYRFSTPEDGYASISLSYDYDTGGTWFLCLYKADATSYFRRWDYPANVMGASQTTGNIGLPKGTYYVSVQASSAKPYRLKVNYARSSAWEKEPANDEPSGATPLTLGTTHYGTAYNRSDADWWKVSVPNPGNYLLAFAHDYDGDGSWTVYTYDSSANKYSTYYNYKAKDNTTTNQTISLSSGTYYFKVVGSSTKKYSIELTSPYDLSHASISPIPTQTYSGKSIEPSPHVTLNGIKLTNGVDYTLSYNNNLAVGTATVVVLGKGAYSGSQSASFCIQQGANVAYRTHVQRVGWQGWKKNGVMSGTSGRSLRLEGINVKLTDTGFSGGVKYRTHIQKIGWQGWKKDGAMSGTSGKGLRLEAIQIKLTGEMAKKYDVYYRVHAQGFGWMGWAKNGASAGTAGYAYRLEGIQIVVLPKGAKAPGATYKGLTRMTKKAFVQQ